MTAFACQTGQGKWSHTSWEIRSVNHRYLEISIRLPEELREIEVDVRECVSGSVHRGKIECVLHY
ncbi:MAG TPA: YicC/YloC family endoribonuclease, partial [Gammaproteobacteria bacterium]|nr:YicC/YloC family endoribonuclease [Gammaproteobacteria bacterium]